MNIYPLLNRVILTAQETAHHADEAVEHHGEHAADHGGDALPHLPSILSFIDKTFAHDYAVTFFAFLIAFIMIVVFTVAASKKKMIPGPLQNFVEFIFESLYNAAYAMLGKETKKYIPFLGTLFLYIWFMNLSGLVPLLHAPTASINMTAALAVAVFLYVQLIAFTRLGPGKYFHHLCGEPNSAFTWGLGVVIILPIHIIGEFAKPFSLAVRLYGNIFGEDTLIAVMVTLGVASLAMFGSPVGIPFQIPFYFLSLLLGTIQALVFFMLSTAYILMALPHEGHAH